MQPAAHEDNGDNMPVWHMSRLTRYLTRASGRRQSGGGGGSNSSGVAHHEVKAGTHDDILRRRVPLNDANTTLVALEVNQAFVQVFGQTFGLVKGEVGFSGSSGCSRKRRGQ